MDVRVGPLRRLSAKELILLNCGAEEDSWESPLDSKEIKPVNPKGNQSWIFIGRTDSEAEAPILCPPDAKRWLNWKRVSLMLGKIEGKRKRERQRMSLWGNITKSMNMNFSKPQEIVKDRETWHASVNGATKTQTQLSDWITAKGELRSHVPCGLSYLSQSLIGLRKKINKEKNRGWKLIN